MVGLNSCSLDLEWAYYYVGGWVGGLCSTYLKGEVCLSFRHFFFFSFCVSVFMIHNYVNDLTNKEIGKHDNISQNLIDDSK